jgi:hypothetical protein
VRWRPRGATPPERALVTRIINCTGPEGDLARSHEPLLRRLLERGSIRPGPIGIGVDADDDARVLAADGTPNPRLYAVGPLTRGLWWEIIAVPDIRGQVAQVGADPHPTPGAAMSDTDYQPPRIWTPDPAAAGRFAAINRPVAGPTHDKALPVGRHPLQLYSLGTPNGVKVTSCWRSCSRWASRAPNMTPG